MGWLSDLVWDIVDEAAEGKGINRELRRALGLQGMEGRSLSDVLTNKQVYPVEGSIVCCLLANVDHSGVYVGDNTIIHRDGEGVIAEVSPREFLARLDGWNPAVTVFVSCRDDEPVGSRDAALRARGALFDPRHRGYNLITRNCHQFCHYCLTGKTGNGTADFTFLSLENEMRKVLHATSWRAWRM